MKTGDKFIQRMQQDAEFRRQVDACPAGEERLAFLKSHGYDFSPFVQIMNNLSYGKPPSGCPGPPPAGAGPERAASESLGRLSQGLPGPKATPPAR